MMADEGIKKNRLPVKLRPYEYISNNLLVSKKLFKSKSVDDYSYNIEWCIG